MYSTMYALLFLMIFLNVPSSSQAGDALDSLQRYSREELRSEQSRLTNRLCELFDYNDRGERLHRVKKYVESGGDMGIRVPIDDTGVALGFVSLAVVDRDFDLLDYLLQVRGSSLVNEPNSQGTTALHYAAYIGDIDVIDKLLKHGVHPLHLDARGLAAADYCKMGKHLHVGLDTRLNSPEVQIKDAESRILNGESELRKNFIVSFEDNCKTENFKKKLEERGMATKKNPLSVSNALNILSNTSSTPGISTALTVASGVASILEDRHAAKETIRYLKNIDDILLHENTDLDSFTSKISYLLVQRYGDSIDRFKDTTEANKFGKYVAEILLDSITKEEMNNKEQGFTLQFLQYLKDLPENNFLSWAFPLGFGSTKIKTKNGEEKVKWILSHPFENKIQHREEVGFLAGAKKM